MKDRTFEEEFIRVASWGAAVCTFLFVALLILAGVI